MKHNTRLFLTLLLAVLLFSTAARQFPGKQDGKLPSNSGAIEAASIKQDLSNVKGSEEYCEENDEECLKRRMIAEAHLDYIYTQHHHHKP